MKKRIDHDQNFKNLILTYMRESLEFFAPGIMRGVPKDARISAIHQQLPKPRLRGRFHEVDIALKAEWVNTQGKRERRLAVFCIENNVHRSRQIMLRHAMYSIQLAGFLKTDNVVPVAVYPFLKKSSEDAFRLSFDGEVFLAFRSIAIMLGSLNALKRMSSKNIVERMCLPLMSYPEKMKIKVVKSSWNGLYELEKDPDRRRKFADFVSMYAPLDQAEQKELQSTLVNDPDRRPIMSQYETLLNMGEKRGKALGRVDELVELCLDGLITPEKARERIELLAEKGVVPKASVKSALKKLAKK